MTTTFPSSTVPSATLLLPPSSPPPIFRLPPELRLEIYSYLLDFGVVLPASRRHTVTARNATTTTATVSNNHDKTHFPFEVWWFDGDGCRIFRHSAILQTARLFRQEALPVIRRARLLVEDSRDLAPLINFLDSGTREWIRHLTISRATVSSAGAAPRAPEDGQQIEVADPAATATTTDRDRCGGWREVCKGIGGLRLNSLTVGFEDEDMPMAGSIEERQRLQALVAAGDDEELSGDLLVTTIGWVQDMADCIQGLHRLDLRFPHAGPLEGKVQRYLQEKLVGVEVGA